MEYRLLKNGQKISTIGIGVGNYGYANVPLAEIEKIFHTAFDGGVNFFDTCMSASWPAEAVRKVIEGRRDKLIMQNHLCVGYPDGNYHHFKDLASVKDAFANELKKYGTDYSDIGLIHFADDEKDVERMLENGLIEYALRLKEEGIIRNVGFSSHTPRIASRMLDLANFDNLFFGINAGYDYEPCETGLQVSGERADLYEKCASMGVTITVMKVYNNSQLLDKRFSPFGRAMTHAQCLQYALDRPAVVSCLAGAITAEEMAQTLRFYGSTAEERDYSFIQHLKKEDIPQGCTYCGHCMPCPKGIEIPSVNRYYDLYKAGDELALQHYNELAVHASACVGCGACAEECPFHVHMPGRMKEIRRYMGK